MFKRINKRIRKKEKEEAIGLDDELKGILGMNDTDSDESDSSSDSDRSDSDDGSEDELLSDSRDSPKLKLQEGEADDSDEEGNMEEDDSEDEQDDTIPPMTISEALVEPLYAVRPGSDARACILCPGKELKHAKMVSVHVSSSTHLRRMKRFTALAARVGEEDEDPRLLVAALDESVRINPNEKTVRPANTTPSTEPRMSRQERRAAKRQRRQERKAARDPSSKPSASPSKDTKKQHITTAALPKTESASSERTKLSKKPAPRDVIQTKLANKQMEAVKRHKNASARKSGHLRRTALPKKRVA